MKKGLPGNHHFYISFNTAYPGVDLPDYLREEYPDTITIVLQYEFWDLEVNQNNFYVTLCFNDIHERIAVPYKAIVSFVDPSCKFGLQFTPIDPEDLSELLPLEDSRRKGKTKEKKELQSSVKPDAKETTSTDPESGSSNVITLDSFRRR
jgi:hypothetical protein